MYRFLTLSGAVAGLLLAVMTLPASATTSANVPERTAPSTIPFQTALQTAGAAFERGDYASAAAILTDAKNRPDFASYPAAARYALLRSLAFCEELAGQPDAAFADLQTAEQTFAGPYDGGHFIVKALIAQSLHKTDILVDTMMTLSAKYPEAVRNMPLGLVRDTLAQAGALPNAQTLRRQLLENLRAAAYQGESLYHSPEDLWFELFQIYVDQGVDAGADSLMNDFKEPKTVIRLRADKRYRRFVEADEKSGLGRTDFKKVMDAAIVRMRALSDANPRQLEGAVNVAALLIKANRLDEAGTVIDAALAKIKSAPDGKPAYDDQATQYNWLLDTRSQLLEFQGKTEQIAAAKEAASTVAKQQNADSVSQTLNLGVYYVGIGQPQKALDAISAYPADKASPYGHMVAAKVRVCAYAQLGQKAQMEAELEDMSRHASDSMAIMREALSCANDTERLAKLYISNLEDPETRNDTLLYLQHYLPRPYASEAEKKIGAMTAAVLAHSDVSATIAKYGTIDTYPAYWTIIW